MPDRVGNTEDCFSNDAAPTSTVHDKQDSLTPLLSTVYFPGSIRPHPDITEKLFTGMLTLKINKEKTHSTVPVGHCQTYLRNPRIRLSNSVAHMSCAMRKPDFCLGENKGADQLRSNCEADLRLCFRYTDSTIPLLFKSKISSF